MCKSLDGLNRSCESSLLAMRPVNGGLMNCKINSCTVHQSNGAKINKDWKLPTVDVVSRMKAEMTSFRLSNLPVEFIQKYCRTYRCQKCHHLDSVHKYWVTQTEKLPSMISSQ